MVWRMKMNGVKLREFGLKWGVFTHPLSIGNKKTLFSLIFGNRAFLLLPLIIIP
jgi:hypothetical protein